MRGRKEGREGGKKGGEREGRKEMMEGGSLHLSEAHQVR